MRTRINSVIVLVLCLSVLSGCVYTPIIGCMEVDALNYDETATAEGECNYESMEIIPQTPHIISTIPANGADNVDSNLSNISVTFDIPMLDDSWSWVMEEGSPFPTMIGDPWYDDDRRTNTLPVNLESDTDYVIWINSVQSSDIHKPNRLPTRMV